MRREGRRPRLPVEPELPRHRRGHQGRRYPATLHRRHRRDGSRPSPSSSSTPGPRPAERREPFPPGRGEAQLPRREAVPSVRSRRAPRTPEGLRLICHKPGGCGEKPLSRPGTRPSRGPGACGGQRLRGQVGRAHRETGGVRPQSATLGRHLRPWRSSLGFPELDSCLARAFCVLVLSSGGEVPLTGFFAIILFPYPRNAHTVADEGD